MKEIHEKLERIGKEGGMSADDEGRSSFLKSYLFRRLADLTIFILTSSAATRFGGRLGSGGAR